MGQLWGAPAAAQPTCKVIPSLDARPRPPCAQLAEEELSEEDQKLKDDLELMVVRAADADAGVAALAIESLGNEIRWGRDWGICWGFTAWFECLSDHAV